MKFSLGWAIGVLVCCMAVLVLYMYTSSDEDAEQKPEQSGLKFGDCDDRSASVHPGAPELADGKDNDCDGKLGPGECFRDDDCPRPESLPNEYLWGCSQENGTAGQCTSCEDGSDGDGYCNTHEKVCGDGLDGDADLLIDRDDPDCANSPLLP